MFHRNPYSTQKLKKIAAGLMSVVLTLLCMGSYPVTAVETPEKFYEGITDYNVVSNNISYTDIGDSWAREAIYETGALNLMKGFGSKQFRPGEVMTKEQALALAYRLAGREADAQKEAEALNSTRASDTKKTDPISMWADGYIQLAAKEGLISLQDQIDAFTTDPTTLGPTSFYRNGQAQRQELANWIAKALQLEPVYDQQKIFNSYNDWRRADPEKIPYIEAVLQQGIMNGDAAGNFSPTQSVTREQAAQIMKNSQSLVLTRAGSQSLLGTIEDIAQSKDYTSGQSVNKKDFKVRNTNGRLHNISVVHRDNEANPDRNELNGRAEASGELELVVYKDGEIGSSDLLSMGDRVEYIVDAKARVRYVKIISNKMDTKYTLAKIEDANGNNLTINVTPILDLDTPNIKDIRNNISFDTQDNRVNASYRYSSGAGVTKNGRESKMEDLEPGSYAVLTIKDNIVVMAQTFNDLFYDNFVRESNIVNGIVEDNNPQLGYITLYNEDGTGTSPEVQEELVALRTFNYGNQNSIEVLKNHEKAKLADIEVGNSVFLKLDDKGNVVSISAVDNYTVRYAKVMARRTDNLVVQYDDGSQQVLDIDDKLFVISDGKVIPYSGVKDGDRVKLTLHITNKFTRIKQITVEGDEHFIANIYKGIVNYVDDTSGRLVAQNLQIFDRGRWIRTDTKGFTDIPLSDEYNIYFDSKKIDVDSLNTHMRNNEAYIAVEKDYGGEEKAVLLSFRNSDDTEAVYDDTVSQVTSGKGKFTLKKEYKNINVNAGTIVVKDGRLVTGNSISREDLAYVIANRSYDSGNFNAGIVQINERPDLNFVQIYRARIKSINANKDFIVESFSQLKGTQWEFANTPKTFKLGFDTQILGDSGIVNVRDFVGYGDNSYTNRVVYIIAKDTDALMLSTAPYGIYSMKGEIFDVAGGIAGEDGEIVQQPTGIRTMNSKIYDSTGRLWADSRDLTLGLTQSTVILKNEKLVKPSELKKGDKVRVIKKDNTLTGDVSIVIVEN